MFRKTCPLIEKEKCTPQHAVTVEMNVKYHSNQKMTDLFIAENASKTTNQPQEKVAVDLAEDLADLVVIEVQDLAEETIDHVKCLTQNAATVEMIVKFHSSQKTTDLCIAENVSKIINQLQEVRVEDLVEDLEVMVEIEVLDLVEEMIDHEKCLTQNAGTVEMIVKYHSNQKKTDLFIAEIVSKITDRVFKLF